MRLVLKLCAIAFALGWFSAAASAADYWVKIKGSKCTIWSDEKMAASEVVTWSGGCKGGKASGNGKLTWTEGGKPAGTYEGVMRGGKLNGEGVLRVPVKGGFNEIAGVFKDGDLDGPGLFKDAAGNVYEGELKDGKPHGTGYQKVGDDEYLGAFENGLRQGLGVASGKNTTYMGEFANDVASGSGVLEDADGGIYHGQFKDNKPHGFGTYIAGNGAIYQGKFVNGHADGEMVVRASETAKPVIETWKDGKKVK